jgi:hypothetical protein
VNEWQRESVNVITPNDTVEPKRESGPRQINLDQTSLSALMTASINVSKAIRDEARGKKASECSENEDDGGISTYLDVYRLFRLLQSNMERAGLAVVLRLE